MVTARAAGAVSEVGRVGIAVPTVSGGTDRSSVYTMQRPSGGDRASDTTSGGYGAGDRR